MITKIIILVLAVLLISLGYKTVLVKSQCVPQYKEDVDMNCFFTINDIRAVEMAIRNMPPSEDFNPDVSGDGFVTVADILQIEQVIREIKEPTKITPPGPAPGIDLSISDIKLTTPSYGSYAVFYSVQVTGNQDVTGMSAYVACYKSTETGEPIGKNLIRATEKKSLYVRNGILSGFRYSSDEKYISCAVDMYEDNFELINDGKGEFAENDETNNVKTVAVRDAMPSGDEPPLGLIQFSVSPENPKAGDEATISWEVENAHKCVLKENSINLYKEIMNSGSYTLVLEKGDYIFKLACNWIGGGDSWELHIGKPAPSPPAISGQIPAPGTVLTSNLETASFRLEDEAGINWETLSIELGYYTLTEGTHYTINTETGKVSFANPQDLLPAPVSGDKSYRLSINVKDNDGQSLSEEWTITFKVEPTGEKGIVIWEERRGTIESVSLGKPKISAIHSIGPSETCTYPIESIRLTISIEKAEPFESRYLRVHLSPGRKRIDSQWERCSFPRTMEGPGPDYGDIQEFDVDGDGEMERFVVELVPGTNDPPPRTFGRWQIVMYGYGEPPDTSPPTISEQTPSPDATLTTAPETVSFTLSDDAGIDWSTLSIQLDNTPLLKDTGYSVDEGSGNVALKAPLALMPEEKTYTIKIDVKDINGNPLAEGQGEWAITVKAEATGEKGIIIWRDPSIVFIQKPEILISSRISALCPEGDPARVEPIQIDVGGLVDKEKNAYYGFIQINPKKDKLNEWVVCFTYHTYSLPLDSLGYAYEKEFDIDGDENKERFAVEPVPGTTDQWQVVMYGLGEKTAINLFYYDVGDMWTWLRNWWRAWITKEKQIELEPQVGKTLNVYWKTENAETCTASGDGVPAEWSGDVNQEGTFSTELETAGTVTYTLTCAGPGGSVTKSFTVDVLGEPEEEPDTPAPAAQTLSPPTDLEVKPMHQKIELSWKNPDDENFAGVKVLRKETGYPVNANDPDAVQACPDIDTKSTSCVDEGLTNKKTYYYALFAYDTSVPAKYSSRNYNAMANAVPTPWETVNYNRYLHDVRGIRWDSAGDTWFGVGGHFYPGAVELSGDRWTRYQQTLEGAGNLKSIEIDQLDNVWIATEYGVFKLIDGNWVNFMELQSKDLAYVLKSYGDSMFVGTIQGIYTIDSKGKINNIKVFEGDEEKIQPNIESISIDSKNNVYAAGHSAVYKLTGEGEFKSIIDRDEFKFGNIYAMSIDERDNLWVTGTNYLYRLSIDDSGKIHKTETYYGDTYTEDIEFDDYGSVWVGTQKGLFKRCSNGQIITYTSGNSGLVENYINTIAKDAEGNLWVGLLYEDGVNKHYPQPCVEDANIPKTKEEIISLISFTQPNNHEEQIIDVNGEPYYYWDLSEAIPVSTTSLYDNSDVERFDISGNLPYIQFYDGSRMELIKLTAGQYNGNLAVVSYGMTAAAALTEANMPRLTNEQVKDSIADKISRINRGT